MKIGSLVGQGKTAEVYKLGKDRVIKLFFDRHDDKAQYEARNGNVAHEAGIPSPYAFDIIEVDGRKGIVFQRIFGKTITSHIELEPWKLSYYAEQMARFHNKIHQYPGNGLPSQKEGLANKIGRSYKILGDKTKRILDYMEGLPDGNSICHGDLHLSNVIVSDNGLVAVDWNSACKGNPFGDVARTCLSLSPVPIFSESSDIFNMLSYYQRRLMYRAYAKEYLRLSNARFEDIDAWILPVAAAKLKGKKNREKKWLLDLIENYMSEYNV